MSGAVGRSARVLGFAGLLPQVAAVALVLDGRANRTDLAWIPLLTGYWLAMSYAALILSFLGGIWWGFAMRRDERQASAAAIAVLPSLVALACLLAAGLTGPPPLLPWAAVALGSAVMLTLLIDRHFVTTGEAPAGWTGLRVPLSLGLGILTIAAGALVGG